MVMPFCIQSHFKEGAGRGNMEGEREGTQKRSSQKNGPILGFLKYNQNYKAEVL